VKVDVVPLVVCCAVLRIPYMYMRDLIFIRREVCNDFLEIEPRRRRIGKGKGISKGIY
jgi:hypothetical protein